MLAVETSSRQGSVALACGGEVLAARELSADRRHAAELLPAVQDLLHESGRRLADVTLFGYSCGPGSFTGLRVAATIGRMMQSAVGCRVVAVETLEVIARNALTHPQRPSRLAVILDARRGRIFGGLFERRGDDLATVTPAGLHDPGPWLANLEKPLWILGEGIAKHAEAVAESGGVILDQAYWPPRAEQVIAAGLRLSAAGRCCRREEIIPHYLRPPECEEVYEQRRAEARARRGE